MTILYDNGEVEIYIVSGDIVVEVSAHGQAEVALSASQARAIAAALIQAAEEKEEILRE